MILLDDVIQVFARPDLRLKTQHSVHLHFSDSGMRRGISIERNPLRSTMLLYCSCEEMLS
jgi:hypothetical protein